MSTKISEASLGQPVNIFIVTDGTTENINTNTTYPKLSLIFVPIREPAGTTDLVPYKMYLSDADGKIHTIQ